MCIKKLFAVTMACAVMVGTTAGQPVDPCQQTTQLTGATKLQISGTRGEGKLSGTDYHYEIWYNNSASPTVEMSWYGANQGGGGAFNATWSNSGNATANYLARVGYFWGGSSSTQYTSFPDGIFCDFNHTKSGTGGGWSYFGIYGWSLNPNASDANNRVIEFYIVEDWFNSGQMGPGTVCGNKCSSLGTLNVDGGTYNIYTNVQVNQPWVGQGNTGTFLQIFSVRQGKRTCGTISVVEHFKKWEQVVGVTLGNLYEIKFKCEVGGGTGSFDARWLHFRKGGGSTTSVLPSGKTVIRANAPMVSVRGRMLNVSSPDNSALQIRMIDVRGKVRANFNANGNDSYSLAKVPAGRYFVEVRGAGVRQTLPVVVSGR